MPLIKEIEDYNEVDCKVMMEIVKYLQPDIGIVTMTDYNSRELELAVRQTGIIYYMIKSVDKKVLKIILDHISNKRGGEKPWQN